MFIYCIANIAIQRSYWYHVLETLQYNIYIGIMYWKYCNTIFTFVSPIGNIVIQYLPFFMYYM